MGDAKTLSYNKKWIILFKKMIKRGMEMKGCGLKENEVEESPCVITTQHNKRKWNTNLKLHNTSMARLVALQQNQLSFPPLASSLSDFNGTRLQTHIQVLHFPLFYSFNNVHSVIY